MLEEERRLGAPLPLDSLLLLDRLRRERRIDATGGAAVLQKDSMAARRALERLVEEGWATAHGVKKGRTYTLSPAIYRRLGNPAEYVRQAGFAPLQQEEMVKRYVREHGAIRRRDVIQLCGASPDQATRLLRKLSDEKSLTPVGSGKAAHYTRGPNL